MHHHLAIERHSQHQRKHQSLAPLIARFMGPTWGQHGAHLGPTGPRWAPCWPHESCYLGPLALCEGNPLRFAPQRVTKEERFPSHDIIMDNVILRHSDVSMWFWYDDYMAVTSCVFGLDQKVDPNTTYFQLKSDRFLNTDKIQRRIDYWNDFYSLQKVIHPTKGQ